MQDKCRGSPKLHVLLHVFFFCKTQCSKKFQQFQSSSTKCYSSDMNVRPQAWYLITQFKSSIFAVVSAEEEATSTSVTKKGPFQHNHQSIPTPLYGFLCQCLFRYGAADIAVYINIALHRDQDQVLPLAHCHNLPIELARKQNQVYQNVGDVE